MTELEFALDREVVASRIREGREMRGLTQDDLALLLGIQQGKVSRYENAGSTPNAEFLAKLAVALNVSIDWLLGLSEDKERH